MDLLDSPLNLAHQQSRKADKHLKNCRYDDAIECHKKAADYLTQAMTSTNVQQALESLSLQRENHIRQQAVIREKQRRALMSEKQTPERSDTDTASKVSGLVGAEICEDQDQTSSTLVIRTMHECDSLLQFLNNRTTKDEIYRPEKREVKGTKTPKDDKEVIDELRMHNDALRSHILQFLKEAEESKRELEYFHRELEYSRRENRELRDRLTKVEHSEVDHHNGTEPETFYSMPMALNLDKLPALELPPLEMPKFDFDSLKSTQEEETVASQ